MNAAISKVRFEHINGFFKVRIILDELLVDRYVCYGAATGDCVGVNGSDIV